MWVLDVDGRRLVVDLFSTPDGSDAQIADLLSVVESIRIERVYPVSTPTN
jgi:hypothetical protein